MTAVSPELLAGHPGSFFVAQISVQKFRAHVAPAAVSVTLSGLRHASTVHNSL
jgi:hypothetical protein